MTRVLVTGGNGQVGRSIADLASDGRFAALDIAVADRSVDPRDLAALHIDYVMSPTSAEITSDSDLLYQLNR